ncbi:hypothetical protein V6U77_28850 [Micromonospora sp. CPCC 205546]|uniref:hypothetical protein n=1 Tax=Micromonospora sp. CPCC 205546 TaxID=3122397 RepID=UPI002FEFDFB1
MYPRIHDISFDCPDTRALAGSWPAVLGHVRRADGTGRLLLPPDGAAPHAAQRPGTTHEEVRP